MVAWDPSHVNLNFCKGFACNFPSHQGDKCRQQQHTRLGWAIPTCVFDCRYVDSDSATGVRQL